MSVVFHNLPEGRLVTGEIAMNEQLIRSGEGQYLDVTDERKLWGFWGVQLKDDDTILVHTSYANAKTHTLVVSGYVWERVSTTS